MIILNIGCEFRKREGCINIDMRKDVKPDIVCKVGEEKLPFKDNSVDGVYMHNFLEHVLDTLTVMEEIYRICRGGGIY